MSESISHAVRVFFYDCVRVKGVYVVMFAMLCPGIISIRISRRSRTSTFLFQTNAICLTRFNKIAIQGAPQMAVDKEAISLSRVYSYYSKCYLPLFYV